jgi:PAS domain S-box-containing protein
MPLDNALLERITINDAKLTEVDVSYSNLTLTELQALLQALEKNTYVTTLNVSGNPIGDTGAQLLAAPALAFTSLVANECKITDAKALAENTRFTSLMLASNEISGVGLTPFADNKTLKRLSLAGNNLTDQDAEVLANNTGLSSLILSHNNIGVKGAQGLAKNTTLETLDLSYNMVGSEGAVALAANNQLKTLALAENSIAPEGIAAFKTNTALTQLDVSYNKVDDKAVGALAEHSKLTHLNVGYNQITFDGAHSLSFNTKLVSLIICHNLVNDAGAAALAQHKTLRHLDISGNRITHVGAAAFALNTILRNLILSSNLVGDIGAVQLARNTTLDELLLSYNKINDTGAIALAGNTHLQVLSLNYNKIGERGRQALLANKTLKNLQLSLEQPPEFTEENLDTIFFLSESFLCVVDLKGTIQFFNPAFSRVLGCTDDEILAKNISEFLHPDDKPLLEQRLSQQGKFLVQHFENRYRCKDGSFRHIRWTAQNKHNRRYIVGTDITEQRRAEKEVLLAEHTSMLRRLEEAEKYSLQQTAFIAHLSHELRNPLSGIQSVVEILQAQIERTKALCHIANENAPPSLQKEVNEAFADIEGSLKDALLCTDYQKAILDDNLDIVKITENKLTLETKTFEVTQVIKGIIQMFLAKALQKNLRLSFQPADAKALWVKGDPLRFKQILVNLIGNAIKFTPEGGKIEVALTLQEKSTRYTRMKIDVIDTGIGMSAEEISQLFKRFSQATLSTGSQYGGSGLGLYLAKQLATLMRGGITVTSSPQGSTFSVEVELASASAKEVETMEAKQTPPLTQIAIASRSTIKRSVLIVDDNAINRKVLERLLKGAYTCHFAEDGVAALEAVEKVPVDIILMDVLMPKMDGIAATKKIRSRERAKGLPQIPIIMITANALEQDKQQGLAAGANEYVVKPFIAKDLHQKIDALLSPKAAERISVPVEQMQVSSSHSSTPAAPLSLPRASSMQPSNEESSLPFTETHATHFSRCLYDYIKRNDLSKLKGLLASMRSNPGLKVEVLNGRHHPADETEIPLAVAMSVGGTTHPTDQGVVALLLEHNAMPPESSSSLSTFSSSMS